MRIPTIAVCCLTVCLVAIPIFAADEADKQVELSQFYGFKPLEIFKMSLRSANMVRGDFNNDGLVDIIIADNSKSRIDLLQQRKTKPKKEAVSADRDVNAIKNDWRFEHRKIPVDKQISAMTSGDFNNDGRLDMAYFGAPDRLVVRYQPETGSWVDRVSIRLPGVTATSWIIGAGDMNGDALSDLVVLGKTETFLLYQNKEGKLDSPVRLKNTSSKLGLLQIADLDGDGRDDLCYLTSEAVDNALCARLQNDSGQLGPEFRFGLNRPRGVTLFNLDGEPGAEVLNIDSRTGRVRVSQLRRPRAEEGELAGRLIQYGFGEPGTGKDRDLAIGDLNGDGLKDVVVTDPTGAQVLVFRQKANKGLDSGSTYPGLLGTEQIRLADFDADGSVEVVVLSTKEKTLAISRFEGGRLSFPKAISIGGTDVEPAAFDTVDLDGDQKPEIVFVERKREGRSSKYSLRALKFESADKWNDVKFDEDKTSIPLELKSTPNRLVSFDANGDKKADLLTFFETSKDPVVLIANDKGSFAPLVSDGGFQLGSVSAGAVFTTEDGLLVSQESFSRNISLKDNRWQVTDQYNASETAARIEGSAKLDLDGKDAKEIVLVDSGVKRLRVLRQDEAVYRPWREVELGSLDFRSCQVADLNGDKRDDLLLFGGGRFAVLYAGQTDPVLKEAASFETKLERVFFTDLAAGDLNGDGMADIAVMDTRSKFIELLNFDPKKGLRHALHFKVFESKGFARTSAQTSSVQPREAVIADVTADGRADLLLLTHDRILLYPQDSGLEDEEEPIVQE